MSSSLELTKRLHEVDDDHLRSLITLRVAQPGVHKDYFDLADDLLTTSSVTTALEQFSANELAQLSNYPEVTDFVHNLIHWHLLDTSDSKSLLPEVLKLIEGKEFTPVLTDTPDPVTGTAATAALEHALAHMGALDELCRAIEDSPAKSLATGALSAPETVRLGAVVPEPFSPAEFLILARISGLLAQVQRWWVPTSEYETWQKLSSADKWNFCVAKLRDHLGGPLTHLLLETPTIAPQAAWLEQRFPLGTGWLKTSVHEASVCLHILGLTSHGILTSTGVAALQGNSEQIHTDISHAVPPTADFVFIQHDFTIIAPGPLKTEAENFLRNMCAVESRGVATTYRITSSGVDSLLTEGLSGAQIIAQLRSLSQTDLPQAVEYFISDRAERFGSLTLTSSADGTLLTCRDDILAQTIFSDRSLGALGLRKLSDTQLLCKHPIHVVLRALREAKYSAQSDGKSSGHPSTMPAVLDPRLALRGDPATELVQRLRSIPVTEQADDATWISRQLELAVREKAAIFLTVSMPDGEKDFVVIAKGFANGRLRCLDKTTEVERTLPASHITAVRRA